LGDTPKSPGRKEILHLFTAERVKFKRGAGFTLKGYPPVIYFLLSLAGKGD
jgi:hypothetical protein